MVAWIIGVFSELIRARTGLQDQFYENADSLVGIYRDKSEDCSHCITVDLAKYGDISV